MNSYEIFADFLTNEEILLRENFSDERAIKWILQFLVKKLDLHCATVLFVDKDKDLYSPVYVHPASSKQNKFVELRYDKKKSHILFDAFCKRNNSLYIPDIDKSDHYSDCEIMRADIGQLALLTIPIRYSLKFQGILNCYMKPKAAHLSEDKVVNQFLKHCSAKIGLLRNQCFENKRMEAMQAGERLGSSGSLGKIIENVLKTCLSLSQVKYGFIGMLEPLTRQVVVRRKNVVGWESARKDSALKTQKRFDVNTGITGRAIREEKMIVAHDVSAERYAKLNYNRTWDSVKSSLCMPIYVIEGNRRNILGVITLESTKRYFFSQSDYDVLRTYLSYAAPAIRAAKELNDFQNLALQLDDLRRVVELHLVRENPELALRKYCDGIRDICRNIANVEHVFVAIKSTTNADLHIESITEKNLMYDVREPIKSGIGISGKAVKEKRYKRFNTKEKRGTNFIEIWQEPIESELAVPIVHNNEGIGVINLESEEPLRFKSKEVVSAIEKICRSVSETIARARFDSYSLEKSSRTYSLVGISKGIQKADYQAQNYAKFERPVLIFGASGTGKELVARQIHYSSKRRMNPFIAVSGVELNENLYESELFGHAKGAFTGALSDKMGKLEMAHTGTLFLDELGELPLSLQAKLLRVLQEGEICRVGETTPRKIDIRIIAATNRNLQKMVEEDRFKDDLIYRLSTFYIAIPPLRERKEDIKLLIDYFVKRYSKPMNLPENVCFSQPAISKLINYRWPGNVRQLENTVYSAMARARLANRQVILPENIEFIEDVFASLFPEETESNGKWTRSDALKTLYDVRGNKSMLYKTTGKSRTFFDNLLGKHVFTRHSKLAREGGEWSPNLEAELD